MTADFQKLPISGFKTPTGLDIVAHYNEDDAQTLTLHCPMVVQLSPGPEGRPQVHIAPWAPFSKDNTITIYQGSTVYPQYEVDDKMDGIYRENVQRMTSKLVVPEKSKLIIP